MIVAHKLILKFLWKGKGPRIAKILLKEKNKMGDSHLPSFRTDLQGTIIETLLYCPKNRFREQQNRVQN